MARTIPTSPALSGTFRSVHGMIDRPGIWDRAFRSDSQLSGAIVIDDSRARVNAQGDRIFVIGMCSDVHRANGQIDFKYTIETMFGRSYPVTERLPCPRGSLVRWRLFNTSIDEYPLHLQGFYVGATLKAASRKCLREEVLHLACRALPSRPLRNA